MVDYTAMLNDSEAQDFAIRNRRYDAWTAENERRTWIRYCIRNSHIDDRLMTYITDEDIAEAKRGFKEWDYENMCIREENDNAK